MGSDRNRDEADFARDMRQRIIEALTYPRMLMTSLIDVDECPMHGYFDASVDACQVCDRGTECLWLNRHDEFSVLARKPVKSLFDALTFSMEFVDAYVTRDNHNARRCACETCLWLRETRYLVREYEEHLRKASRKTS